MAKMKKELDPVSERLIAFVNKEGGPSPVASKLGKHPQLFYNIRDGKSKPSMDTLREVKQAFGPNFNLDWVIMGEMAVVLDPTPNNSDVDATKFQAEVLAPGVNVDMEEVIHLRAENAYLKMMQENLQEQVDYLKKDKDQLYSISHAASGDRLPAKRNLPKGPFKLSSSIPRTERQKIDFAFAADVNMVNLLTSLPTMKLAQS